MASGEAKRGTYRAGFFFGALGFGARVLIGFASAVLTARLYGVSVVGDYALVWAPVAALWVISTIKEQQALVKEISPLPPAHPRVSQLFAAVFAFSTGLTAVLALVDALVCVFVFPGPLDAPQLLAPALVSIAGYTLVTNTGWNLDSVLSAFVAGRQLFWVRLNEALGFVVIVAALALFTDSVWALVAATLGASAIALVHRFLVVRPFLRWRLDREEMRAGMAALPELLRFGLKATPGQIAVGISQQGGIWAIGMVASPAVVGAYSRALLIPRNVQQAAAGITEVLFPTLVGRRHSGDEEGFDRALVDSVRYEVVGMLLLAAALGGAAEGVLEIFGPGFAPAAPALILLLFFPVLASVNQIQTHGLWAVDRPGLTSLIALLRLAVTIVLLVVLTPAMNYVGPALALLAGMAVAGLLFGRFLGAHLARPLRQTWPLRERFALVVGYAAGFGAAHAVEALLPGLAWLPLALLAGCAAYAAAIVLCGAVNARDRVRLRAAYSAARSSIRRTSSRSQGNEASSSPGYLPSK